MRRCQRAFVAAPLFNSKLQNIDIDMLSGCCNDLAAASVEEI